jgi:hypothetical protein
MKSNVESAIVLRNAPYGAKVYADKGARPWDEAK